MPERDLCCHPGDICDQEVLSVSKALTGVEQSSSERVKCFLLKSGLLYFISVSLQWKTCF